MSTYQFSSTKKNLFSIRFYATGSFHSHIASVYRVSRYKSTLIVQQVSDAIFMELKSEMMVLTQDNWIKTANEFNFKWQMPNCLGAIDGKHIPITKPKNAGSDYYNFKRFHSIVLLATADANYKFISIDVGGKGAQGDVLIFNQSQLGRMIIQDDPHLILPPDSKVGDRILPHFFLGDDIFPLLRRLIKPYKPTARRPLTEEEDICNYRISRARRCVENAFGILQTKFLCVSKTILLTKKCKNDRDRLLFVAQLSFKSCSGIVYSNRI